MSGFWGITDEEGDRGRAHGVTDGRALRLNSGHDLHTVCNASSLVCAVFGIRGIFIKALKDKWSTRSEGCHTKREALQHENEKSPFFL